MLLYHELRPPLYCASGRCCPMPQAAAALCLRSLRQLLAQDRCCLGHNTAVGCSGRCIGLLRRRRGQEKDGNIADIMSMNISKFLIKKKYRGILFIMSMNISQFLVKIKFEAYHSFMFSNCHLLLGKRRRRPQLAGLYIQHLAQTLPPVQAIFFFN